MIDGARGEQLAQRAVVDVGEGIVGHQPLGDDAVVCEEVQRATGKRGDGGCLLVVVDLAVGQPRAVIDDRVHELPANPARALRAVAGQRVAGRLEAPQALGVHVQQVAGARPLIAEDRRALAGRRARAAAAAQNLVDRRVRPGDLRLIGQPSRAPPRALRSWQIRASSSVGTLAGEWCGQLERSARHANDARSSC